MKDDPTRDIGGGAGGTHQGDRVQGRSPAGDAAPDPYESLKNFLKFFFLFCERRPRPRDAGAVREGPTLHELQKSFYNSFSLLTVTRGHHLGGQPPQNHISNTIANMRAHMAMSGASATCGASPRTFIRPGYRLMFAILPNTCTPEWASVPFLPENL